MATYESKKYATIPIQATQVADGTVSNTEYQHLDGVTSDIQTQLNSISTSGLPTTGGTMTGNILFGDNVEARFGAGDDLRILHDGNNSQLKDAGTGALEILTDEFKVKNAADSETMILANENGAVSLYHDNTARLSTTSSGVNITGTLSATTAVSGPLSGDGSSITSINASNISSGTLASDRIGGNVITGTGSPGYYAQRAWVRFDSNNNNNFYAQQNVSSITDHGVGKYTVNFSTAMPNSNYGVIVTPSAQASYFAVDINGWVDSTGSPSGAKNATAPTTNAVRIAIFTDYSLTFRDTDNVTVSVFGV